MCSLGKKWEQGGVWEPGLSWSSLLLERVTSRVDHQFIPFSSSRVESPCCSASQEPATLQEPFSPCHQGSSQAGCPCSPALLSPPVSQLWCLSFPFQPSVLELCPFSGNSLQEVCISYVVIPQGTALIFSSCLGLALCSEVQGLLEGCELPDLPASLLLPEDMALRNLPPLRAAHRRFNFDADRPLLSALEEVRDLLHATGPGFHHTGQQGRDYQGHRLIWTGVSFSVLLLLLRAEQVNQGLESSASLTSPELTISLNS